MRDPAGPRRKAERERAARLAGAVLTLLAQLAATVPAAAQTADELAGTWKAGPMRVRASVESWGEDCGPRPPATSTEPGGTVEIAATGDHLQMTGAVRGSSSRCWTPNPAVRRRTSSAEPGRWKVTCATQSDDPKAERGTYTLTAQGPNTLVLEEESRYDWQLRSSRCVATRSARRVFKRESPATTATSAETQRCTPGTPTRLQLAPRSTRIAPGEEVCFRARLVDAEGCPTRAPVELRLQHPSALAGNLDGRCFRAANTAAEAEGTFRVIASGSGRTTHAQVEVRAPDLSDLIARRERSTSLGEPAEAEAEPATRVAATPLRDTAPIPWWVFALFGSALVLVASGTFVWVRRKRGREAPAPSPEASARSAGESESRPTASAAPPGPELRLCPVCGHEFSRGTLYCPVDGAELEDARTAPTPGQPMICPVCRRGYPPDARFCPTDAEELVPYAMFVASQRNRPPEGSPTTKICPDCGHRYDVDVRFCGKDGRELVLVN